MWCHHIGHGHAAGGHSHPDLILLETTPSPNTHRALTCHKVWPSPSSFMQSNVQVDWTRSTTLRRGKWRGKKKSKNPFFFFPVRTLCQILRAALKALHLFVLLFVLFFTQIGSMPSWSSPFSCCFFSLGPVLMHNFWKRLPEHQKYPCSLTFKNRFNAMYFNLIQNNF